VDWAPPEGKRPRAIISLTFDCGEIEADADLALAADELDDWALLAPQEAAARLPANVAPRISAALRARAAGQTAYLAGGRLT
jgi:8-oxo-dGTP diphosphatase